MIFVDSNVPMYVVGAAHPLKKEAVRLLEACIARGERLVTDAEVLQEVLHRYSAIRKPEAMQAAFNVLLGAVDEVYPVEAVDVHHAKDLLLDSSRLSARDALHVAIMARYDVAQILSFDTDFDTVMWIERVGK